MLVDIPHVGPGTPCGEWFRRYWVVVGTAQELYDIPRAVKVLGEDLGLVSRSIRPSWTTRRALPASRSFVGVRRYRRWRVALPLSRLVVQRPRSVLGDASGAEGQQVKHLSYPVQELGGLLFAYMGQDKDDPPPLPNYAPLVERTGQWQIEPVRHAEYNWFNFFENSADPAHVCILRYLSRTQRPKRFSKHGRDQPTNNGASTNAQCQGAVRLINSDADRTRKGSG